MESNISFTVLPFPADFHFFPEQDEPFLRRFSQLIRFLSLTVISMKDWHTFLRKVALGGFLMQKQLKITSKNSFHPHAAFLFPGAFLSAQKRGSICFVLQLSPCGSCCIDLLLACASQVSVTALQPVSETGPQSLALKRAAPVYRGGSLGAAFLVDCKAGGGGLTFFFFSFSEWTNPSLPLLRFLIGLQTLNSFNHAC